LHVILLLLSVSDVVKSLASSSTIDSEQWKTLQLYTRKLYSVSDDMLFVGKGLDKVKKAEAEKIVYEFRKDVKVRARSEATTKML